MAKASLPLIRVLGKIPCEQSVVIRHYLTGAWQEHATVKVLIDRLAYMQDTREAEVFGIEYSVEEEAIIIDIVNKE